MNCATVADQLNGWEPLGEDLQAYREEYERVSHEDGCDGRHGFRCPCGCGVTIICPGGRLCRLRIMVLRGREETEAVREWMRLGLCICSLVVKNRCRHHLQGVSDRQYTKASGNWRASRRRKLVQCPCGAFFDNEKVRALGLYSESEWRRKGYPFFKGGTRYYIDPQTAKKRAPASNLPHVRVGPPPRGRIWRPFYDPRFRRFESGLAPVDLFSEDQMDLCRFVLSNQLAVALMDGDEKVRKLLVRHAPKLRPKRQRRKWTAKDALKEYEEQTGFSKPLGSSLSLPSPS